MDNTFQKIPFLRIALALAIGIVLGHLNETPKTPLIISLLLVLTTLIVLNRRYSYKFDSLFGFFTHLFFILLGVLVFCTYNIKPLFHTNGIAVGTLLETPQEKTNSYKSLVLLNTIVTRDSSYRTKEKVLVYFVKEEKARELKPGTQIFINTVPREVQNYGNPYEFDYKSYLNRKRIYRQVNLSSTNWNVSKHVTRTPTILAEQLREKLLKIFRSQNLGSNETEILSALILGYKRDLDPETKRVFSAAGAMHVLAVSGLHVGIIFLFYSYLFGFLKKHKTGRFIFTCTSILLLWVYAFITGLSPSVLRASTMFTIIIIGQSQNRRASIYNSLAASAMVLLLINPNNLFDVGFQLSYSAVFGIVYLQPRFEKLCSIKNKIIRFFWSLLTVSVAAQISTFPLIAYYFNQFPTFFWLSNLVVIPVVIVLVPMSIAVLIISKIHFLSVAFAFAIKWLIKGVYFVLQNIESFSFSTIDISLSSIDLIILLNFLFFVFIFIKNAQVTNLKLALSFLLLLSLSILSANFFQHRKLELIVYNSYSNPTTNIIIGRRNYVISQHPIKDNDFIKRQIQDIKRHKRLNKPVFIQINDSFEDKFIFLKNGFLYFQGETIYFDSKRRNTPPDFAPDFLITNQNTDYVQNISKNNTIVISTNSYNVLKPDDHIYYIKTHGPFHKILN